MVASSVFGRVACWYEYVAGCGIWSSNAVSDFCSLFPAYWENNGPKLPQLLLVLLRTAATDTRVLHQSGAMCIHDCSSAA